MFFQIFIVFLIFRSLSNVESSFDRPVLQVAIAASNISFVLLPYFALLSFFVIQGSLP